MLNYQRILLLKYITIKQISRFFNCLIEDGQSNKRMSCLIKFENNIIFSINLQLYLL